MSTTFTTIVSQNSRPPKYTRHYQPRHPLAKRIIDQIETLERRPQTIVQTMGYLPKHTIPACDRLRHVLSNQYLGLDGSYRDGRFSAEEFLAELLSIVGIQYETVADDIAHIHYQLANPSTGTPSKKSSIAKIDFDYS